MRKNIYIALSISISLFLTSCGKKSESPVEKKITPITVITSSISEENTSPFITSSGKIQAANSANLSTRMMGFVNSIHVKVGDKVTKGQLLISINNFDIQAKLAQANASITQAEAAYSIAEKDYNRFKNLFADTSASQKELDDMAVNFEMAKARLEAAKQLKNEVNAQFAYTNLRAPFNSVITNKFIEVGDMANPGMTLIAVESPGAFEVITRVSENEIAKIKVNQKVSVLVKSLNETLSGTITEVSTSAKNTGGQYVVKITLNKSEASLLSGMYVSVQFPVEKTNTKSSMVLISTHALIYNGQLTGIYTISETNTALLRWLRLGRTYGDKVEVLSGLNADEKYILSAEGKLYNGATITVQ